mgnify:FL=1
MVAPLSRIEPDLRTAISGISLTVTLTSAFTLCEVPLGKFSVTTNLSWYTLGAVLLGIMIVPLFNTLKLSLGLAA